MNNWIYILLIILVTFLVREAPILIFRKPINNTFIKSFLYYVPYVTLAIMTFPAILSVSASIIPGLIALIAAVVLAWIGVGMFPVALSACAIVFIVQLIV